MYIPPPLMSADFSFMITISTEGTWVLSLGKSQFNLSDCQLLKELPTRLLSVADVLKVLSVLNNSRFCIGNSDTKFSPLSERHDGKFKNHAGIIN